MAELLVAVLFLGICATSIIACVGGSQSSANYARRRALALAAAESDIDKAHALAEAGTLVVGNAATVVVAGLPGTSQIARRVTLVGGYTDLYQISTTVSWQEPTSSGNRADSVKLVTYARCPDD